MNRYDPLTKPDLVVPAGEWSSLITAVENGADCVYFGIKGLSMRNLAVNFEISELPKVTQYLHTRNVKAYLALNVIIKNSEVIKVHEILVAAKKAQIDAVILWDKAVMREALGLGLSIHLSTQASVSNYLAAGYYAKEGVSRIVLARECSLDDIANIARYLAKNKMNCGLEVFAHGAMCVSVSGRCFLSHAMFSKSANRGECLQPCRRKFLIQDVDGETEYILGEDYILSPKDLCTIGFIDKIIETGVKAIKIEGRNRSPEYVKVVTRSYREAIDLYFEGKLNDDVKKDLKFSLSKVYTRGFSDGFYFNIPNDDISRKLHHTKRKKFIGKVTKFYKKINVAEIQVLDSGFNTSDELIFMGKHTPAIITVVESIQLNGVVATKAERGQRIGVKISRQVKPNDKVFLWVNT